MLSCLVLSPIGRDEVFHLDAFEQQEQPGKLFGRRLLRRV